MSSLFLYDHHKYDNRVIYICHRHIWLILIHFVQIKNTCKLKLNRKLWLEYLSDNYNYASVSFLSSPILRNKFEHIIVVKWADVSSWNAESFNVIESGIKMYGKHRGEGFENGHAGLIMPFLVEFPLTLSNFRDNYWIESKPHKSGAASTVNINYDTVMYRNNWIPQHTTGHCGRPP